MARERFYFRDGQVWDGMKSLFHINDPYEAAYAVSALNTQAGYTQAYLETTHQLANEKDTLATENEALTRRVAELEAERAQMLDLAKHIQRTEMYGYIDDMVEVMSKPLDYENLTAPTDATQELEAVQPLGSELWQAHFSPAGYSYVQNSKTGEVMHEKFKYFEDAERRAKQQNTTESAPDA